MTQADARITVRNLTMGYGDVVVQHDLSFSIKRGEIFVIMGGSGCGKSTVMRALVGLKAPTRGDVLYDGEDFWKAGPSARDRMRRRAGVCYQGGALWSSMTLAENVGLALEMFTSLRASEIREIARLKLALVGLAGFADHYPSEVSGGMQKRAGVARALAMDPDILFFDEPSAGLDPINSKLLDDLILELRDSLGATVVVVTHELASIFAIADQAVFLDSESKTMLAVGNPRVLRDESPIPKIRTFLTRGEFAPGGVNQ